jgi:hypothetical protein
LINVYVQKHSYYDTISRITDCIYNYYLNAVKLTKNFAIQRFHKTCLSNAATCDSGFRNVSTSVVRKHLYDNTCKESLAFITSVVNESKPSPSQWSHGNLREKVSGTLWRKG